MSTKLLDHLAQLLRREDIAKGDAIQKRFYKMLSEKAVEELNKPTHVAVIGKSGVGKTSTINALFGTDWKVSHVRAATKQEQVYLYESERGRLKISDLPGLGEDISTEDAYRSLYLEVLEDCEVAILVIKADTRDMREVQSILQDVVSRAIPNLHERIVIGLNQVDLVQPGGWIEEANVPSRQQLASIEAIVRERHKSIQKVCPIDPAQVVAYSAKKRYRLHHLFLAMMSCTRGEAWVLDAKKNIAEWADHVDPTYLPSGLRRER